MKKLNTLILLLLLIAVSSFADTGSIRVSSRIIGGYEATPGEWPFMAALVYSNASSLFQSQFCAGALINENWVLTAAHCVEGMEEGELNIVMGIHDLGQDTGERFEVRNIIIHPEYDSQSMDNDIALVELSSPSSAMTIPLISAGSNLAGMVTIIGWGSLTDPSSPSYPYELQEAVVPVVSNELCNANYSQEFGSDNPVTANMLCAGFDDGGVDTCVGDSGGPVIFEENGVWKVAGIVSWGQGCAEPSFFGVYTRVSNYLDFISNNTQVHSIMGSLVVSSFAGHENLTVNNAVISLEGTTQYVTGSDGEGRFVLNAPGGDYILNISATELSSISREITVVQNETLIINETMVPQTYIEPAQESVIVDDDLNVFFPNIEYMGRSYNLSMEYTHISEDTSTGYWTLHPSDINEN